MSDRYLDSEAIDQAMNEAVLLSDQDPRRIEVMKQVVEAGGEAERQWLDLVAKDQKLRLDLQRLSVPAGLADRLRRLPEQAPQSMPWPRFQRAASWLSAAAVIGVADFKISPVHPPSGLRPTGYGDTRAGAELVHIVTGLHHTDEDIPRAFFMLDAASDGQAFARKSFVLGSSRHGNLNELFVGFTGLKVDLIHVLLRGQP